MTTMAGENSSAKNKVGLRLAHFFATGCYSGLAPRAPGTMGTLAAALILLILSRLFPAIASTTGLTIIATTCLLGGIFVCNLLCRSEYFGKDKKDPQQIVIDEFAGFYVSLIGLGAAPKVLLIAFLSFRFFDIIKPPPIRLIEKLPQGYGIMLDDILAGCYAALLCRLIL